MMGDNAAMIAWACMKFYKKTEMIYFLNQCLD